MSDRATVGSCRVVRCGVVCHAAPASVLIHHPASMRSVGWEGRCCRGRGAEGGVARTVSAWRNRASSATEPVGGGNTACCRSLLDAAAEPNRRGAMAAAAPLPSTGPSSPASAQPALALCSTRLSRSSSCRGGGQATSHSVSRAAAVMSVSCHWWRHRWMEHPSLPPTHRLGCT
jgi:hypothetical protein